MKIAGFRKTSLIDYSGNIAAVVFTQGCNFRCPYCHNPELIASISEVDQEYMDLDYLWDLLQKREDLLDGVVITGGEPTLQQDLIQFCKKIKSFGMKVKLDTNGSRFEVLKKLVVEQLVDYVAMDIKSSLRKKDYNEVTGVKNSGYLDNIRESIDLLITSEIEYEFRTTVVPGYHGLEHIQKIANDIIGAEKYVLQNFRPEVTLKQELQEKTRFPDSRIEDFKEKAQEVLACVEIKNQ